MSAESGRKIITHTKVAPRQPEEAPGGRLMGRRPRLVVMEPRSGPSHPQPAGPRRPRPPLTNSPGGVHIINAQRWRGRNIKSPAIELILERQKQMRGAGEADATGPVKSSPAGGSARHKRDENNENKSQRKTGFLNALNDQRDQSRPATAGSDPDQLHSTHPAAPPHMASAPARLAASDEQVRRKVGPGVSRHLPAGQRRGLVNKSPAFQPRHKY